MISRKPPKNDILVVIIGRVGMGKSSLFNSLFGAKIVPEGDSCRAITTDVTVKDYVVNGITVKLVDTPGFGYLDGDPTDKVMEQIAENIPGRGENVTLVLYCLSMGERLNTSDRDIAKCITERYKEKLWENTIFALTYANRVTLPRDASPGGEVNHGKDLALASHFNKLVAEFTEDIRTKLLRGVCELDQTIADGVPVLPVGYVERLKAEDKKSPTHSTAADVRQHCTLPNGSNWLSNLWYQSFLRISNPSDRYAFYRATCNIHPYKRENEHRSLRQQK